MTSFYSRERNNYDVIVCSSCTRMAKVKLIVIETDLSLN